METALNVVMCGCERRVHSVTTHRPDHLQPKNRFNTETTRTLGTDQATKSKKILCASQCDPPTAAASICIPDFRYHLRTHPLLTHSNKSVTRPSHSRCGLGATPTPPRPHPSALASSPHGMPLLLPALGDACACLMCRMQKQKQQHCVMAGCCAVRR